MFNEQFVAGVLLTVFFSTLMRSTFGFGDALIAMPLLALFVELDFARPLIALVSVVTAFVIVVSDWRQIEMRSTWRLVVSCAAGIPFGVFLLTELNAAVVKAALAIVILAFATYSLTRPKVPQLRTEKSAFFFGFVAGALGGAYNTVGPPLVIYGAARRWSAEHFRATMQGIFLPTSILIVAGHGVSGLLTKGVLLHFLASLPLVLIALWAGKRLNHRLPHRSFLPCVYGLLIVIGAALLFDVIRG